jgi:hypothetical protein
VRPCPHSLMGRAALVIKRKSARAVLARVGCGQGP